MKSGTRFPKPGQRILRSAIAVALCFMVYILRGRRGIPFYSALAVLQCIQPYYESTAKTAKKRVTGTFIGAFWGLLVILIQVYLLQGKLHDTFLGYLLIAAVTGVVLYSTVVLKCTDAAYFSCVVFLSIVVMHIADENPILFVFNRVMDTLIGVGLAFLVNSAHLPREKNNDILFVSGIDDTLLDSQYHLTPYSRIELNQMIEQGAHFTVSTIRTPASLMEVMQGVKLKYPVIAMDGAVLYDMKENSYLMKYQMSESQAERMADFLTQQSEHYFVNTVVDDTVVIYYDILDNEAQQGIFNSKRRSPYRNYVHTQNPSYDNVIYFFLIDQKEKIEHLYESLIAQPWASEYRIAKANSVNYPGYAHLKIYHKDATREHMLENLKAILNLEKTVTFGSIQECYDVFIEDSDRNLMVREMKKRYKPVCLKHG